MPTRTAPDGPRNRTREVSVRAAAPGTAVPVNLCVVRGECSAPPEVRVLPSGARLASFSVRVRAEGSPTTSVPVALWDPPARVETLAEGSEVVVIGRVVRRFFRTPGGPGSRVEVQAHLVAPAGDRRRLVAALRRVETVLDALVP